MTKPAHKFKARVINRVVKGADGVRTMPGGEADSQPYYFLSPRHFAGDVTHVARFNRHTLPPIGGIPASELGARKGSVERFLKDRLPSLGLDPLASSLVLGVYSNSSERVWDLSAIFYMIAANEFLQHGVKGQTWAEFIAVNEGVLECAYDFIDVGSYPHTPKLLSGAQSHSPFSLDSRYPAKLRNAMLGANFEEFHHILANVKSDYAIAAIARSVEVELGRFRGTVKEEVQIPASEMTDRLIRVWFRSVLASKDTNLNYSLGLASDRNLFRLPMTSKDVDVSVNNLRSSAFFKILAFFEAGAESLAPNTILSICSLIRERNALFPGGTLADLMRELDRLCELETSFTVEAFNLIAECWMRNKPPSTTTTGGPKVYKFADLVELVDLCVSGVAPRFARGMSALS